MLNFTRRGQLRHLIHSCPVASFALPMLAQSQQPAAEVEEVVATVTHTDLYESVAPSVGLNRYRLHS
jgi:hypothetical protein